MCVMESNLLNISGNQRYQLWVISMFAASDIPQDIVNGRQKLDVLLCLRFFPFCSDFQRFELLTTSLECGLRSSLPTGV